MGENLKIDSNVYINGEKINEVEISFKDNFNLYLGCMAEYASTVVNGTIAIADEYNHDRLSAVKHLTNLLKCLTEMDDFTEWGV